ncbi:MAG: xanthine dehydrogenase family protein molybdopterin-binding subunit, partial [Rhodoblastus sp.]
IALRKRNHIRPDELPFTTAAGSIYDSGEFSALLDAALEAADYKGFAARKAESARNGKLRGLGVGQYLEITAPPTNELGEIIFEENGGVTIRTGTLDFGQGHATTFAQILVSKLGMPFECIRLVQGDSDQIRIGGGTGGSKSTMASGAAFIEASEQVIERGKRAAAHLLEAAVGDIEFAGGAFSVAGTDRAIGVIELAKQLRGAGNLPEDVPASLDVSHVHKASPSAYPNGCHVAEVEVEPETGMVAVVRYTIMSDFGTIVNPMIVEGQSHGGVMQAIGQALLERVVFDGDGQLMTGSFTDYAMPRAMEAPPFVLHSRPTPATTNPLGAKGCGEAGCAGGLPSVVNALVDALRERGVSHVNMPATPEVVWRLANGK